jgi:hypothetical protein
MSLVLWVIAVVWMAFSAAMLWSIAHAVSYMHQELLRIRRKLEGSERIADFMPKDRP